MSKRYPKNPSFSSVLLDEMFRSIDGKDEKFEEIKVYKEQPTRKNNHGSTRMKSRNTEDEELASLKRTILMEKIMEKKVSSRKTSSLPELERRSLYDNDHMLFSTSSSSSDSSSNGFSSSDAEFYASAKSRASCFSSTKPKPNKASYYDQNEENKSRALKIYSNLKKVKQPISPGGRLTNFINSLFTNGNAKKTNKNVTGSTCSTATSFSRSCLSKNYQTDSTNKFVNNGVNRTVRLGDNRHGRKHIAETVAEVKSRVIEKNRKIKEGSRDVYNGYLQEPKKDYFMKDRVIYKNGGRYEDEEYDDAASDASSDLFEIDHLALHRENRFCDELPVYETTYLDRNRAIARGLMC